MDIVKQFRENTRQLECHLANINQTDCCCGGISGAQCFVIVEIGRKPGISIKELAEILCVDKSGISRTVEELVQKEFVERKPSKEDRRFVALYLLAKGQARFEKIEQDMNSKFREILSYIPSDKHSQVVEVLQLFNEACLKVESLKKKGEQCGR